MTRSRHNEKTEAVPCVVDILLPNGRHYKLGLLCLPLLLYHGFGDGLRVAEYPSHLLLLKLLVPHEGLV